VLYISLVSSTVLLLIANLIARRSRHAITGIACIGLAFLFGAFLLMCILPPVALQSLLLCVAAIVCRITHRGLALFVPFSCGATLIAYGVAGIMVVQGEREYARLRSLYPYESMEARLRRPRITPDDSPLLPIAALRLSRLEERLPAHAGGYREHQLEKLHEHTVDLFVNSPGFGVARMSNPSEWSLAFGFRRGPIRPQPGSRFLSIWSPGAHERLPADAEAPLGDLLEESILEFVNDRGFGYFKDRRHVSGFQPHEFSEVPSPANRWKLQTLELISLLLHDEPEVYVSTNLPRMNKLHDVPTRPLDGFESFALSQLRTGEDVFTSQATDGVRMLGAIRSTKQCIACHACARGVLLGAFSYTLVSSGR
jgi:hypothetical protein